MVALSAVLFRNTQGLLLLSINFSCSTLLCCQLRHIKTMKTETYRTIVITKHLQLKSIVDMGFLLGRTSRVIGAFSGLQMTEMVAALNAVCRLYGRGL